jgi:outer membrane protein TolC
MRISYGMRRLMAVAAVGFVMTLPRSGAAQGALADTLDLSLDEAYRIAGLHNPAYRRSLNDVSLNAAQTRTTWLTQVLPRLSIDVLNTGYSGRLTPQAFDFFGNPIDNPQSNYVFSSSTSQGVSLTWNIQGASLFQSLERQRLTNADRALAGDGALWGLRSNVRRQFFAASREAELLRLERDLLEERRVDHDLAERLFELAAITRVDLLNAELEIEQQALNIQSQDGQYQRSLLTLRTTLGEVGLPPIRLAGEPQPVFDPAGLDAESLVRTAMNRNLDIRQARAAVTSASHAVSESKSSWWPNLSARFDVGRFTQTRGRDALFDLKSDDDLQSQLSLQLSIPFFNNYFQNSYDIQEAEVQVDNRTEDLRNARLSAEEQVRGNLMTLNNQYETYRLAQRSHDIAQEARRLAREEYRLGTRTFTELRDIIDEERNAARQVIEARYGFVDALVSLEEAVGTPVDPQPSITGGR